MFKESLEPPTLTHQPRQADSLNAMPSSMENSPRFFVGRHSPNPTAESILSGEAGRHQDFDSNTKVNRSKNPETPQQITRILVIIDPMPNF